MKNWKSVSMEFKGRRLDIQPFAGVYPTRWKISAMYSFERRGKLRKFEYLGKPNATVATFVMQIVRGSIAGGQLEAKEFDRGGVLAYAFTTLSRGNSTLQISDWTQGFRFYYPFCTGAGEMVSTWMRYTFHRLPVVFQGKKCLVYSQYTPTEIVDDTWRIHKVWLSGANLQLGKPQLTSTK
jgi:hypothetical protein